MSQKITLTQDDTLRKSNEQFRRLRTLAIAALICTLALTLFMWIESLLPFEASLQHSINVSAGIKDAFDIPSEANPRPYGSYGSFYLFIRKFIGHYLLFSLLGFGLSVTFFLLLKPRWLAPVLSLAAGFLTAGISELLQLPIFTDGRHSNWSDVGLDMTGIVTGIAFAAVVISITCLIWEKAKPESFARLKSAFSELTYKTAFKKTPKARASE